MSKEQTFGKQTGRDEKSRRARNLEGEQTHQGTKQRYILFCNLRHGMRTLSKQYLAADHVNTSSGVPTASTCMYTEVRIISLDASLLCNKTSRVASPSNKPSMTQQSSNVPFGTLCDTNAMRTSSLIMSHDQHSTCSHPHVSSSPTGPHRSRRMMLSGSSDAARILAFHSRE